MSEKLFDLIFKGEVIRPSELDQVKLNLARLFKIDAAKVDALFGGKAVVLKRNLTLEAANKYRVAIKKAGARVDLVASSAEAAASASGPAKREPTSTTTVSQPAKQSSVVGDSRSSRIEWQVAEAGADLLSPAERKVEALVDIDVSALSIKNAEGNLLNADEERVYKELDIDLSALDIAPAGSDVLKPDERKQHKPVDVDTSDMSLLEVGTRLSPEEPEAPPAPDVSHISVQAQD